MNSYMDQILLDFLNKYFGVANVGDTPENKGECVGLIEVFLDVLNLNTPHLYGNAKDLLENADKTKFDVVYNDPNNYNQFPPRGAIMVADSSWGWGKGHTGLVLRANGYTFSLFDQNNPVGSRPTITNYHNYAGWKGWLIPKK